MGWTVTIAGAPQVMRHKTLTLSETLNGRTTARFEIVDEAGVYRPAKDAAVLLSLDGVPVFGGTIESPAESALTLRAGIVTAVDALDYSVFLERICVEKTYSAGFTALQVVTDIWTTYLSPFGFTLDPLIDDGPILEELTYDGSRTVASIYEDICAVAGWVRTVSPTKVISMFEPGDTAHGAPAPPYTITDADPHFFGDLLITPMRDGFANRIILRYGQGQRWKMHEPHAGNGVTRVFALDVPAVSAPNIVWQVDGITGLPVGIYGIDDMAWTFEPSTNSLHQRATETVVGIGEHIEADYFANYPGTVIISDPSAAASPREKTLAAPDCFDPAWASALATGYLARAMAADTQRVQFTSLDPGWHPGQVVSIQNTPHAFNSSCLVTDVETRDIDGVHTSYTVSAVAGDTYPGSWRDLLKQQMGGSSGSVTMVIPLVLPTPGSPVVIPPSSGTGSWADAWLRSGDVDEEIVSLGIGATPQWRRKAVLDVRDYPSIQAALDAAVVEGGGIVHVPEGVHLISANLSIGSNTHLRGVGLASIIRVANGADEGVIHNADASNSGIKISDLTLDGNAANQTGPAHIVTFLGVTDSIVERCALQNAKIVTGTGGDGVYLGGNCQRVLVRRNYMTGLQRNAISIVYGSSNVIEDNDIDSPGLLGVDIEPNLDANSCEDNEIRYNRITDAWWCGIGTAGDNSSPNGTASVARTRIIGNVITRTGAGDRHGIEVQGGGEESVILFNRVSEAQRDGIKTSSDRVTIVGNTCLNNGQDGDGYYGITINASYCLVCGNHCTDTQGSPKTQGYGIGEYTADYNVIVGNDVIGNNLTGIGVAGAHTIQTGNGGANPPYVAVGSNPATVGAIRTSNNDGWVAKTAAGVDKTVIMVDASDVIEISPSGLLIYMFLPQYDDDAAAGVGGLTGGMLYKTPTGEVRVKL